MKKSSAFVMVVPGLVILVVCLFLPLLKVLNYTLFAGEYPLSSYVDFFLDEYYLKIFVHREGGGYYDGGMYGGRCSDRVFYQPVRQKMAGNPSCGFHFPDDDKFCHPKLRMDQYPGK